MTPLALAGDRLGAFAGRVFWFSEIGSTNDEALARAEGGGEEGIVVVADRQSRGRGRLGRTWSSPAGAGIYASAVLRPVTHAPLLTLAAGVAIAEGIQTATGLDAVLKWPNDICMPGTRGIGPKLGGILTEAGSSRAAPPTRAMGPYAVVGFGINVQPAAYPPDIAARATCIERELGRMVDRGLVLAECLAALWRRYVDLQEHRTAAVMEAWRARAGRTLGRPVEWDAGTGGAASGVAEGIDGDGALLVRTAAGLTRIVAGEVRWR